MGDGFPIRSYRELMGHIAALAYLNKDHLLFFRGQPEDYLNKADASTLYPTIYRGERIDRVQLNLRFDLLHASAARLCDALQRHGVRTHTDVRRRRHVQWSILQHYDICATPLLDFTHSLRVACSFALLEPTPNPHVYVLALPYITNRVSINSEHDLVNVRLLSICPPEALRPYYQDGYLAGTDEVMAEFDKKDELDFNNRLVAKFRITSGPAFWDNGFSAIPRESLYPAHDIMRSVCGELRTEVGSVVDPGRVGEFLQAWTELEGLLLSLARDKERQVFNVRSAIVQLKHSRILPPELLNPIDHMRDLRNRAVHHGRKVNAEELLHATHQLRKVIMWTKEFLVSGILSPDVKALEHRG